MDTKDLEVVGEQTVVLEDREAVVGEVREKVEITGLRAVLLALCMCGTTFITALTAQSVLLALPSIGRDLNIPSSNLQWLQSSYSLAFGCFLLLSGRLADLYGRKVVYLCGIANFGVWNIACGAMRSEVGLDVARALAGVGAAMSIPSAVGIIAESFPNPRTRSLVFASFGACNPIGASFGMVLGGLLSQYVSWRPIFYIIAGISVVPFAGAWVLVPWGKRAEGRVDWVGAGLVTSGLVLILFVLSDGINAPNGWATGYIIALLILGILLLTAFILWQHHLSTRTSFPPLMKLSLFTRGEGRLAAIYIIVFLCFSSFSAFWLITDLYYQSYLGVTPVLTMVRYLPTIVSGVLFNILVGLLAATIPGQLIICFGVLGTGLASLLFAVIEVDAVYWRFEFFAMVLTVAGPDCVMALGMIFISKLVAASDQSVAAAIFQTCMQIGSAMGVSVCTIAYSFVERREVARLGLGGELGEGRGEGGGEAFLVGLRAAFFLSAGMGFAAFFPAAIMLRGMGTAEDKKVKEDEVEELQAYTQEPVLASSGVGELIRVLSRESKA